MNDYRRRLIGNSLIGIPLCGGSGAAIMYFTAAFEPVDYTFGRWVGLATLYGLGTGGLSGIVLAWVCTHFGRDSKRGALLGATVGTIWWGLLGAPAQSTYWLRSLFVLIPITLLIGLVMASLFSPSQSARMRQ